MKKHKMQIIVIVMSMMLYAINGMDNKQKLSIVERKIIKKTLSQLSFADNKRILHVGHYGEDLIKKNVSKVETYTIDVDTLNNMVDGALTYDKIISVIYWDIFKKSPKIFENSKRLLKYNGQICMVIPYHKSPYLRVYRETLESTKWKGMSKQGMIAPFYSRNKIKELCEKAKINFTCEIIEEPFVFDAKKKFVEWVASSVGQLGGVVWWYYEDFTNDVVHNYLQKYPLVEGRLVALHFPYMIINGSKL